jgi:thioredoxin reductase (NADPH)
MHDILVIGAGPSGLATAIAARTAGLSAVILEQGGVADAIRRFPVNMTWFSTPELLEIGNVPFVIPTVRPTRVDTLNYYRRVTDVHKLDIRMQDGVESIRKESDGSFAVTTRKGRRHDTRAVVIATGYFDQPARLGIPGEGLPHVFHYYDEPFRFAGMNVVVVGGRNSGVETALDLYRHGARVLLVHRGPVLSSGVKYWILPDIENRIKSGEIQASFETTVQEIRDGSVLLSQHGEQRVHQTDCVFVLIGFGPDSQLLRSAGVELDPETLAPVCDPTTLETNIPGLFVAGSVVAGKETNKIFVENGRLHGDVIVRTLLRDRVTRC